MTDPQYTALTDERLHAAHRARLARHQGIVASAPHESTTLLGACTPRKHEHREPVI